MNLSVGSPMPLGERCVDWLESEVREWIIGKVRRGNYWLEFLLKALVGMSVMAPILSGLLSHDGFLSECLPS